MKITDVRAVQPVAENSPPDWRTSLGQILVAIDTDVGLTGYGVGGGGLAGIHVIRSVLRDVLLGQNPEDIDGLWNGCYASTLAFGRKGLAIMAQSGVDLALWDLRGKSHECPVAELLGGTTGEPIATYGTFWGAIDPQQASQFRAFKLHLPRPDSATPVDDVVRTVAEARNVVGHERPLMVDAWMRWDLEFTLAVAERLMEYDVGWIEEPLSPDDLDGYEQLSRTCPIPIAGGEHEFTFVGFRDLIERRLHQVLQPDVCWCGGLTELIKIYKHAQSRGLRVCPHRGAELWSLHAIAALDQQPLAESGRPWMTWVGGQPPIEDGTITLSDTPGFGVSIDESQLETIA